MEIIKASENVEVIFAIKGLANEGASVKDELYSFLPQKILVGISPEEVAGLKEFIDNPFTVPMGDYEAIYGTILSKFGEVEMPPPIFTQAVIYAKARDVDIYGLDLDEKSFGDKYEENFRVWDMVRYIRRKRRMMRHKFDLSSPETFIMQWKNLMEDNPSIRKMEEFRQNAIKENLSTFLKENGEERILAVIEYEMKNHLISIVNSEVES